jgi:NAD(P)-dependent dehydrogenase (short-subunit alcohol dehydrogenase family)
VTFSKISSSLAGRVALITGGASGIGAATARVFTSAGIDVVLADISEASGNALVAELTESAGATHGRATFVPSDVREPDQIEKIVATTVERHGRLDILFNNAGIGHNAPLVDHSLEDIDALIDINFRASVLACRAALPHLVRNPTGGVILNNSSNGGLIGRAADPVYVATKHALIGLTKSLALAHAHEGIRVNALCCGPIDTPMVWKNFASVTDRSEALHRMLATCPDPRLASAADVAEVALFLCSDAASFINGIALPIDGGKAAGVMVADRYRLDFEFTDPALSQLAADADRSAK